MSSLSTFEETTRCLEAAAKECKKTVNVDLDLLINEYQKGAEYVDSLKAVETRPVIQTTCHPLGNKILCSTLIHINYLLALPRNKEIKSKRITRDLKWDSITPKSALKQLSSSQAHNLNILLTKRSQLNQTGLVPTSQVVASGSDEGSSPNSNRIAIEDTVVARGGLGFCDVAGLAVAKDTLREAIILPLQYPHLFTGGRKPWRRILLYGPPGTGKSRLAQAVASEVNSTFYSVSSSDLISSWFGESEKLIKELFHDARKREGRSVIFIDEIDSVCRKRSTREEEHTRRIKTELLKQMEGVESSDNEQYFLLCATNCPWELDSAFLRRFQKRIYIPLPDKEARIALMKMHLGSTPADLTESDWSQLAEKTEGYSGSDVANCTSDALFEPIRELQHAIWWQQNQDGLFEPCNEGGIGASKVTLCDIPPSKIRPRLVVLDDFIKSLTHNQSTVTEEDIHRYQTFTQSFGQKG